MTEIEQQRTDFEAAVRRRWTAGYVCCRRPDGEYDDDEVRTYWYFWQAAIEHDRKQQDNAIRNAALEEAAKILDGSNNYDNPMTAIDCADAIRAIKTKEPS